MDPSPFRLIPEAPGTRSSSGPPLAVRAKTDADADFLWKLYLATRAEEFAPLNLPPAQLEALIADQWRLEQASRAETFPNAEHRVILLDGQPIGRVVVDRQPVRLFGVDFAILPQLRCRGYGGRVLHDLQREAAALGVPFALRVFKWNRARNLYLRLGFRDCSETDLQYEMKDELPAAAAETRGGTQG
ncbi:MAG: GNAT family N-acetyltransferase [Deltaproteobacteria bacterium]|nr:GNAT family N-acetyltransferase [Deltaproteobacteria bacterium]